MAAFPVTFGHRWILPPGPGHRANRGPGPDQPLPQRSPQFNLLGNVRDLENRGGHPGHDQGRRLSIPQVVAPLYLEMRSWNAWSSNVWRRRASHANHKPVSAIVRSACRGFHMAHRRATPMAWFCGGSASCQACA